MAISVEEVLHEIKKLPGPAKLELIEKVAQGLRLEAGTKHERDWNQLYGLGKGLWSDLDAQDYVNQLRTN